MSLYLNIFEQIAVLNNLISLNDLVLHAGKISSETLRQGGKILFCGNGGSAADSQHLATELTGRFIKDRRPLGRHGTFHRLFGTNVHRKRLCI